MSPDEAERRIRELEEEVTRLRFIADSHKGAAYEWMRQEFPYQPLTDEEVQRLVTETDGTPIREILAELERELQ